MENAPPLASLTTPTSPLHARSFARFLQPDVAVEKRDDDGLEGAFRAHFPRISADGLTSLEYLGYLLDPPRYDEADCLRRGYTFSAPMKVVARLVVWEDDNGTRLIRDVKEQEVYFGEVPLLTGRDTFVHQGVERVPLLALVPLAAGDDPTAPQGGPRWRVAAAGDHMTEAARAGLANAVVTMQRRLERAAAVGDIDTRMPCDLVHARPLAAAFKKLLEKSPRLADVDDTNPVARVAQGWTAALDDDRAALDDPALTRWFTPLAEGLVALSPDAPLDAEGTLDAAAASGDVRPLVGRLAADGDALLRALPLAEATPLPDAPPFARAVAARGGALVLAARAGVVQRVSERRVWVLDDGAAGPTRYALTASRAPWGTTRLSLRPAVSPGTRVAAGDTLAHTGAETLALGRRCAVAWRGDLAAGTCRVSTAGAWALRSLHRGVIEALVRDTKFGVEALTRDVPGVDARSLRHLDASGVVTLGASVEPGDVLAGLVSPAADEAMQDVAVRATARATVVGVEVFRRRGQERSERHAAIVEAMKADVARECEEHLACLDALGADDAARGDAQWRYRNLEDALDRGDELAPGVVSRARIELLEERPLRCGDELADGRGGRWTVVEVSDAGRAEVELAGDGEAPEVYLMKLRAAAVRAAKKPARRAKRGP